MYLFDEDYCLCGNPGECPLKDQCKRAERKVGIHSYANFYAKNESCEHFYMKEGDKHEKLPVGD